MFSFCIQMPQLTPILGGRHFGP